MFSKDRYLLLVIAVFSLFLTSVITKASVDETETTTQSVTEKYIHKSADITTTESQSTEVESTTEKCYSIQSHTETISETESVCADESSSYASQNLLAFVADSVNKTKHLKNKITVKHTENFDIIIESCTGGSVVNSALNKILTAIISPTDEILEFSAGKAVNSDGETVSLLLPQQKDFSLPADGVRDISLYTSGDKLIVKISLVSETVSLYETPRYNASCIGYLDTASLDLNFVDVAHAEIAYSGSEIVLHISSDGYVTRAEYKMPVKAKGSARLGFVNGNVEISGVYTEIWELV